MWKTAVLSTTLLCWIPFSLGRPNIIVMQPDDFPFMDEWTGPPDSPLNTKTNPSIHNDGNGLQYLNKLREEGLQMMQAYAAAPMCGTSRYSTITGKMPSRAKSVQDKAIASDPDSLDPAKVTIPTTKLTDDNDQHKCSQENLAWAFKNDPNPYRTGMFGKWHLSDFSQHYDYDYAVNVVEQCGFDTVGSLYIENLNNAYTLDGLQKNDPFSHNMEFMTYEAVNFIKDAANNGENFFMYFNPTVPHASGDVKRAIADDHCENDIPNNTYDWTSKSLLIPGMMETPGDGCATYRKSIQSRAQNDDDLGKVWVDDAVGGLLQALKDAGVEKDTIFLFQEDHGMDAKGTLYEGGIRIPQFIHYPNGIAADTKFHGLVSTVDIAATMMDYAGITPPYDLDGKSWKDAIPTPTAPGNPATVAEFESRCLFFESEKDRAVRCGCYKYIDIANPKSTTYNDAGGMAGDVGGRNLFDLCGGTGTYITAQDDNQEEVLVTDPDQEKDLISALECHTKNTHHSTTDPLQQCTTDRFCQDSTLSLVQNSNYRTCAWISKKPSRCGTERFYSHCTESCNLCHNSQPCQDSKAAFQHPDGTSADIRCRDVTQQLCDDYPEMALWTCPDTCGQCW